MMSSYRRRMFVVASATLVLCAMIAPALAQSQRVDEMRYDMVTAHIEAEGITNKAVLNAMRAVPRHEFVPSAQKARAYEDLALPIGHQQTISPPYIVAYMTNELDPQANDRVLEIGTGSGYQASILAHCSSASTASTAALSVGGVPPSSLAGTFSCDNSCTILATALLVRVRTPIVAPGVCKCRSRICSATQRCHGPRRSSAESPSMTGEERKQT